MDNRLQVLSWLMLMAMLSMMAVQSGQSSAARPMAAMEPGFRALPTVLAMSLDQLEGLLRDTPEN
jgi:hypothetical protein